MNALCPACEHGVQLIIKTENIYSIHGFDLSSDAYNCTVGECPLCSQLICIWEQGRIYDVEYDSGDPHRRAGLEFIYSKDIIFPRILQKLRTVPAEIPEIYKKDFLEAWAVRELSPQSSAALSRRILQTLLREHFKIKHYNLIDEIEEFIQLPNVPSELKDDVDAIRNIGNFAAHPSKSTTTGDIVGVEPGEAEWLIEVLESLFDFAFVQPKRTEERRNKLNAKLQDIGKPPMKKS